MLSDLRQAARNYLLEHDEPDPAELVDGFVASLDPAEAMELMRFAAHTLLLEANRSTRRNTRKRSTNGSARRSTRKHSTGKGTGKGSTGGKSWRKRSRAEDLLGARHQLGVGGPWKVYRDCSPDDVDLIAGALFQRADEMRKSGDFYTAEAAEARQRGAATMGDLYALREAEAAEAEAVV